MAQKESDRVQREIEELLGKLDNFVPEERLVSKIKKRRKEEAGPSAFDRFAGGVKRRFSHVTLGHVMLFGVILLLGAQFVPSAFFGYDRLALITGLLLTVGAFILSAMGWDSRRTIAGGGSMEKRWRGQTITYNTTPPRRNRFRDWFRRGPKR